MEASTLLMCAVAQLTFGSPLLHEPHYGASHAHTFSMKAITSSCPALRAQCQGLYGSAVRLFGARLQVAAVTTRRTACMHSCMTVHKQSMLVHARLVAPPVACIVARVDLGAQAEQELAPVRSGGG